MQDDACLILPCHFTRSQHTARTAELGVDPDDGLLAGRGRRVYRVVSKFYFMELEVDKSQCPIGFGEPQAWRGGVGVKVVVVARLICIVRGQPKAVTSWTEYHTALERHSTARRHPTGREYASKYMRFIFRSSYCQIEEYGSPVGWLASTWRTGSTWLLGHTPQTQRAWQFSTWFQRNSLESGYQ